MAKLFTRIYGADEVLNVPGHIELDVEVNTAIFDFESDLSVEVKEKLEKEGTCEVKVFCFRFLDYEGAPDEPATAEELQLIDENFENLVEYIECDNDAEISIHYWLDVEGNVQYETLIKDFEELETVDEDSIIVDTVFEN